MAQGNLQAEASQLHQLIQLQPRDAAAHNDLGVCFVQQKNYVGNEHNSVQCLA